MNSREAWDLLVLHCRWLGIKITHRKIPKGVDVHNGIISETLALATTNQRTNWQENFDGAFTISLYFPKRKNMDWYEVAILVHEMGHVADYRENMYEEERTLIQNERSANQYGIKIAQTLSVPVYRIKPYLSQIIREYQAEIKRAKNKEMNDRLLCKEMKEMIEELL